MDIQLTGRENYFKTWRADFFCQPDGHCGIECDGGSVELGLYRDGYLHVKNNGFIMEGGCDGGETKELFHTPGGDDEFRLVPLPAEYCSR